ncbi:MAG TPA: TauD/TfdA family dioxygenase [Burkholderiales bacterium]|nr:TauD/TfdA family dioxygenase [Burkholderiales bacterium]
MQISKLKEHIGAEVTGIDLREPIDEATRKRLNDAAAEHVALVIRDQRFTAAQYQAAAELFGELMPDQNRRYLVEGLPLVSVLSNRHKDSQGRQAKVATNATWHTDHTNQERPPKFTMLYPVALPDKGGGTSVCNMRAAYEALPAAWKERITRMKTENTLISSARMKSGNPDIVAEQQRATVPPVIQPLVRTHPETGTKAIWFHKGKTERVIGMAPDETQKFLDELLEIAIKPEFVYVHEYRLGDMLIIDDRSAMHKAGFDYDHSQHRMLYRILVRGDRPF